MNRIFEDTPEFPGENASEDMLKAYLREHPQIKAVMGSPVFTKRVSEMREIMEPLFRIKAAQMGLPVFPDLVTKAHDNVEPEAWAAFVMTYDDFRSDNPKHGKLVGLVFSHQLGKCIVQYSLANYMELLQERVRQS